LTADEQKSEKERCQKWLKPWKNTRLVDGNRRNPAFDYPDNIFGSLPSHWLEDVFFFWFEGIPKVRDVMDFDEFC